jgi:hypothetical protein
VLAEPVFSRIVKLYLDSVGICGLLANLPWMLGEQVVLVSRAKR